MDNLEPITRNEMFLNGEDLEPITREEMILAGADLEPLTRHEWFLKKYRGGGDVTIERLAVTENGTYSESGKAYSPVVVNVPTPPIPENAYLLNNLSGLPADIASFTDGTDLPMASLKVAVTPYQDLHGYDGPWAGGAGKNKLDATLLLDQSSWNTISIQLKANTAYTMSSNVSQATSDELAAYFIREGISPGSSTLVYQNHTVTITTGEDGVVKVQQRRISGTDSFQNYNWQIEEGSTATTYAPYSNICPIIGWDEAVVTVADDVDNPTVSNTYTIDLDGTRYGAEVDVVNGSGTDNRANLSLNSIDAFSSDAVNENGYIRYNCGIVGKAHNFNILCDKIKVIQSTVQANANEELISGNANNNKLYFTIDSTRLSGDLSTSTGRSNALKTYLTTNDIQVVYELAEPLTVQLSPTAVKSLEGTNNIFANCGNIIELEYFSKEV